MSTRAELVARWQDQLAVSESLLDTSSSRLWWLWRMRARLYRFLLSCYGESTWETEPRSEVAQRSNNSSALIDNTATLAGLQPRSADRIRATLESVKVAIDRDAPQGPLVHGLAKQDWIRVAAFRHAFHSNRLLLALAVADIDAKTWIQGKWFVVEVRRLDYDAAFQIAREVRRQSPGRFAEVSTSYPVNRWHTYGVSLLIVGLLVLAVTAGFMVFGRIVPTESIWDDVTLSLLNWSLLFGIALSFFVSIEAVQRLVRSTPLFGRNWKIVRFLRRGKVVGVLGNQADCDN